MSKTFVLNISAVGACCWLLGCQSLPETAKPPPRFWLGNESSLPGVVTPVSAMRVPVSVSPVSEPGPAAVVSAPISQPLASSLTTLSASMPTEVGGRKPPEVLNAKQCWAQMQVVPLPEERTVTVVKQEGAVAHVPKPAVIEVQSRSVTTRESALAFRVVAPRFKAIQEQVKVSDEVRTSTVIPAVYEVKKELVMVESAKQVLRTCQAKEQRAASPDRRSLQQTQCVHEVPARYQTVVQRVLVKPQTVKEEVIPARYKTITKWVVEENGQAIEEPLPERKTALAYKAVMQEASLDVQQMPPQTLDISVKTHVGKPALVMRQVLCEHELSPNLIRSVQTKLQLADPGWGSVDGKLGPQTWRAVQSYQLKKGLASGFLSYETLYSLGVWLKPDAPSESDISTVR